MNRNPGSWFLALWCWVIALCCVVVAQAVHAQDRSTQWPEVHLDVHSGTFFDPLPFDTPFLVVGQVPTSVQAVSIQLQLWMVAPLVFGEDPERMRAFEARLSEALAACPKVDVSDLSVSGVRRIQQHFTGVLVDIAQKATKRGVHPFVNAPNTCFDLEGPVSATVWNFVSRLARWQQAGQVDDVQELMDILLFQARSAQVGLVDPALYVKEPVSWQRQRSVRTAIADSTRTPTSSGASIWNRLQQQFQPGKRMDEGEETTFRVMMQPLDANRYYLFDVQMSRSIGTDELDLLGTNPEVGSNLESIVHLVSRVEGLSSGGHLAQGLGQAWVRKAEPRLVYRRVITTDTRANGYVGADVGVLYAGDIDQTVLYVGANFYLRPINKSVPLRLRGGFLRRFALTAGVTLQGIGDVRQTRENLLWAQSLMLGVGYRVSQYIRVGAGILIFRERNPDTFPLSRDTRLTFTPQVSLSFDVDVGHHLNGLGAWIGF